MGTSVSPCLVAEIVSVVMGALTTRVGAAWQGLTLVHFSAQPEPFMTQNTP